MATTAIRGAMGAVWSKPVQFSTKAYALEVNAKKGIIGGYLTLYNNPETQQPYVDPYLDVVCSGFMTKTIKELYSSQKSHNREFLVPYLWQHMSGEIIGGVKHLSEDSQGVIFETQLAKGVKRAEECFALHEQNMPMGVSYGYDPIRAIPQGGLRYLKEVALKEVSSVTFPAHEFAGVTSVKNFSDMKQGEGARTFADIMEDRKESDLLRSFFNYQDALASSILECCHDQGQTDADAFIDSVVEQYAQEIKDWYPEYIAIITAQEPGGSDEMGSMPMVMSANFALTALKSIDLKTVLNTRNKTRIADAIAHMSNRIRELEALLEEPKSLRELFTLPTATVTHQKAPATSTPPATDAPTSLYDQLVSEMKASLVK